MSGDLINASIHYREMITGDIPAIAKLRAAEWGDYAYWLSRITKYHLGGQNPQYALKPRVMFVACIGKNIVGFIAGHLTTRLNCEGELEWINVRNEYRSRGVASQLVKLLMKWFAEQHAFMICVDPGNEGSRIFYKKIGAENLNEHWMYWKDIRVVQ